LQIHGELIIEPLGEVYLSIELNNIIKERKLLRLMNDKPFLGRDIMNTFKIQIHTILNIEVQNYMNKDYKR